MVIFFMYLFTQIEDVHDITVHDIYNMYLHVVCTCVPSLIYNVPSYRTRICKYFLNYFYLFLLRYSNYITKVHILLKLFRRKDGTHVCVYLHMTYITTRYDTTRAEIFIKKVKLFFNIIIKMCKIKN